MLRQFVREPLAVVGLVVIALWTLAAVFAPVVAPFDPLAQDGPRAVGPSAAHWFGTDQLGRDVFSRVVHGARISLSVGFTVAAVTTVMGGIIGGIAGYFGGIIDDIFMRIVDLFYSFPNIILAMAVVAALGPGLTNAMYAIIIVSWQGYARLVRSQVMSIRQENYVDSTRLLGASSRRALGVDVLPNIAGPGAVLTAMDVGYSILALSGLSFLGLGASPPAPEWGSMVAVGTRNFAHWWVGVFPGFAILTVVVAFNFIGDSLRDVLDPFTARESRVGALS